MPRNYKYNSRAGAFLKNKTRQMVNYEDYATEQWALLIAFFRYYPDYLEDLMESPGAEFHNALIGRVIKRAMCRYAKVFIYGARGLSKTTCVLSAGTNKGITFPGEVIAYYGPAETQMAKIAGEAYKTYAVNYPYLAKHWIVNSASMDSFKISTEDGSSMEIDIDRGRNTHCVIAEECGQEDGRPFDWDTFNSVVRATNRKQHMINGIADKAHCDLAEIYITSASRKDNPAYGKCRKIRQKMADGESAFAMWVPWQVPVLCKMRTYEYYANLRDDLTAEQFMRECESKCTGSVENPIIQDSVLEEAKVVKCMEERHCGDPKAFYVLGYDPSSRDISGNALCGFAAIKCERQYEGAKMDRYKKSLVYVTDSRPPKSAREHATIIKKRWRDYTMAGSMAFIVIDARQYGQSIVEHLHENLGDGLPPLSTVTHEEPYVAMEQPDAIACIYPLQATGNSGRDPNSTMLDYIEREFENGNLRLLTTNLTEGLHAYKLLHEINDDYNDPGIQHPYVKTRELCTQIRNLQKKYTSTGWVEAPISRRIVHDMWSATLYAARYAQRLEHEILYQQNRTSTAWEKYSKGIEAKPEIMALPGGGRKRSVKRMGRLCVRR